MSNLVTSFISRQYHKTLTTLTGGYEPVLDVSRYQYPINWQTMWDRGVRLVILRLSIGDYYKDTRFDEFYTAARAQGFQVGVYHVTRPSIAPVAQWNKVLASLAGKPISFFVLDNELTDGKNPTQISDVIEDLTYRARNYFGAYPVQYLRGEWWNTNTVSRPVFGLCPLMIARYTNLPHPWDDAPALRPRDWTTYDLHQYSADGNGQGTYYGVGSADVDISRAPYATLEETMFNLNGVFLPTLPPPDPEGDPLMRFVNIGNDISNIRFAPVVNTTNIIGKLPPYAVVTGTGMKLGNGYTWIEYDVDPVWLLPGKTGTKGWSALIASSGTILIDYLDTLPTPDPAPVAYRQTTTPANLRWSNAVNGQGYPIMSLPPVNARPKFAQGAVVVVVPEKVNADGSVDYWTVLNGNQANPPTYPQPAGYEGRWFISDLETMSL